MYRTDQTRIVQTNKNPLTICIPPVLRYVQVRGSRRLSIIRSRANACQPTIAENFFFPFFYPVRDNHVLFATTYDENLSSGL